MQKLITKCSDCLPVSPSKFSSPFLPTSLVDIVRHESNQRSLSFLSSMVIDFSSRMDDRQNPTKSENDIIFYTILKKTYASHSV